MQSTTFVQEPAALLQPSGATSETPLSSDTTRSARWRTIWLAVYTGLTAFWSLPRGFENRVTQLGVLAVLTMSAIQTAFFFGLASPDLVEKLKALIFSGWMDFALFMAFLRVQRRMAQEEYRGALAWFVGCLPLASFTFLCNFMFSSHWQPPDPLALERVGLSAILALWIYASVPLAAVVYGTLFTVREITPAEKQRREEARVEAAWQAELATPRGYLRIVRRQRELLMELLHLSLKDERDMETFADYEDLLAERGISPTDRTAPIKLEAVLLEMRRFGIAPSAPDAVARFRSRSLGGPAQPLPPPPPAGADLAPPQLPTAGFGAAANTPGEAEVAAPVMQREEPVDLTSPAAGLPTEPGPVLPDGSGKLPTYLTLEEFRSRVGYSRQHVNRLVRRGEIRAERIKGEPRIPLAELARFAATSLSQPRAAAVLAECEEELE